MHSSTSANDHPILNFLSSKTLQLRFAPGDSFAIPEPKKRRFSMSAYTVSRLALDAGVSVHI
ncbi:MAG: hypothetical protein K2X81_09755, partial [Candidatus Obscuribacterales bacterium]|nr:hypothetical protein [Candidatus Obscuribacterales bacterium]